MSRLAGTQPQNCDSLLRGFGHPRFRGVPCGHSPDRLGLLLDSCALKLSFACHHDLFECMAGLLCCGRECLERGVELLLLGFRLCGGRIYLRLLGLLTSDLKGHRAILESLEDFFVVEVALETAVLRLSRLVGDVASLHHGDDDGRTINFVLGDELDKLDEVAFGCCQGLVILLKDFDELHVCNWLRFCLCLAANCGFFFGGDGAACFSHILFVLFCCCCLTETCNLATIARWCLNTVNTIAGSEGKSSQSLRNPKNCGDLGNVFIPEAWYLKVRGRDL